MVKDGYQLLPSFCVCVCFVTVCNRSFSTRASLRFLSSCSSASTPSRGTALFPALRKSSSKASGIGVRDRYCMRVGCGRSNTIIWTVASESPGQRRRGNRDDGLVKATRNEGLNARGGSDGLTQPSTCGAACPQRSNRWSIGCGLWR